MYHVQNSDFSMCILQIYLIFLSIFTLFFQTYAFITGKYLSSPMHSNTQRNALLNSEQISSLTKEQQRAIRAEQFAKKFETSQQGSILSNDASATPAVTYHITSLAQGGLSDFATIDTSTSAATSLIQPSLHVAGAGIMSVEKPQNNSRYAPLLLQQSRNVSDISQTPVALKNPFVTTSTTCSPMHARSYSRNSPAFHNSNISPTLHKSSLKLMNPPPPAVKYASSFKPSVLFPSSDQVVDLTSDSSDSEATSKKMPMDQHMLHYEEKLNNMKNEYASDISIGDENEFIQLIQSKGGMLVAKDCYVFGKWEKPLKPKQVVSILLYIYSNKSMVTGISKLPPLQPKSGHIYVYEVNSADDRINLRCDEAGAWSQVRGAHTPTKKKKLDLFPLTTVYFSGWMRKVERQGPAKRRAATEPKSITTTIKFCPDLHQLDEKCSEIRKRRRKERKERLEQDRQQQISELEPTRKGTRYIYPAVQPHHTDSELQKNKWVVRLELNDFRKVDI